MQNRVNENQWLPAKRRREPWRNGSHANYTCARAERGPRHAKSGRRPLGKYWMVSLNTSQLRYIQKYYCEGSSTLEEELKVTLIGDNVGTCMNQ